MKNSTYFHSDQLCRMGNFQPPLDSLLRHWKMLIFWNNEITHCYETDKPYLATQGILILFFLSFNEQGMTPYWRGAERDVANIISSSKCITFFRFLQALCSESLIIVFITVKLYNGWRNFVPTCEGMDSFVVENLFVKYNIYAWFWQKVWIADVRFDK